MWLALLLFTVPVFAQRVPYLEQDGERIYQQRCASCHLPDGRGSSYKDGFHGFPPLTGMSEWFSLREGQRYAAYAIIYGPYGGVLVGDQFYFGMMPRYRPRLNNRQIVAVLRYIAEDLNTPRAEYGPIDVELVEEARRLPDNILALKDARSRLPPR